MNDFYDYSLNNELKLNGETDDSPRIQRAINAADGGVLYIPKGTYELATPLFVKNNTSLLMHSQAKFIAVSEMDYMLTLKYDSNNLNAFITGGEFDARGKASCLFITGCRHLTVKDISLLNAKKYGLRTQRPGCEIIATNIYCRCNMSGLAGNTGISIDLGDSHYTDCIVVDYTVGMEISAGSCRLTRCHVWGGVVPAKSEGGVPEMLVDSVCFKVLNCDGNDCLLRDCYADTGAVGFEIHDNTRIIGGAYLNAECFVLDNITVIDHSYGHLYVEDGFYRVCTKHGILYRGKNKNVTWGNNYVEGNEMYLPQRT